MRNTTYESLLKSSGKMILKRRINEKQSFETPQDECEYMKACSCKRIFNRSFLL